MMGRILTGAALSSAPTNLGIAAMKLASYVADGKASFGVVAGDGAIDVPPRNGGKISSLREALAANALDDIRRLTAGCTPDRALSGLAFLPVVPDPQRIVCVGINYRSHAEETGRDISPAPSVFLRLTDTLLGHGQALVRPRVSDKFDFEGETRRGDRAAGPPRHGGRRARP